MASPHFHFPVFSASRIHILGAPGSGVTTMGAELASQLGYPHFDTDDFHWFTDDPEPYRRRRNPEHRRQLLEKSLQSAPNWILSGSLCGWGDPFAPLFDLVILNTAPVDTRLARIRARELARYGADRLAPGGDLNGVYTKFLQWAADYDQPSDRLRTFAFELDWVKSVCSAPCWLYNSQEWTPI